MYNQFVVLILMSLFLLVSCNQKESNQQDKINIDSTVESKDIKITSEQVGPKYDIKGIWWIDQPDEPTAAFLINDSVFFYPDQEEQAEFPYKIVGNQLTVFYDGYNSISTIIKATNDTLILMTDDEQQIYIKSK